MLAMSVVQACIEPSDKVLECLPLKPISSALTIRCWFVQFDGDAGKCGGSVHPQRRSHNHVASAFSARPANNGYITAVRRRLAAVSTVRIKSSPTKTLLDKLKYSSVTIRLVWVTALLFAKFKSPAPTTYFPVIISQFAFHFFRSLPVDIFQDVSPPKFNTNFSSFT